MSQVNSSLAKDTQATPEERCKQYPNIWLIEVQIISKGDLENKVDVTEDVIQIIKG